MPAFRSEGVQTVKNDELDVVAGLLDDRVYETLGSVSKSSTW
jgi:hypothetical protein